MPARRNLSGVALPTGGPNGSVNATASDYAYGLPSYAQGLGLKNRYDNLRGIYNYKDTNTRRQDQGMSNAMSGGMTHVIWIGDSGSAGCTSLFNSTTGTFDRLNAVPIAFRNQLANMGIPANGTGFIRAVDGNFGDSRFVSTGSWSNQLGYGKALANGATLTLTADRSGTIADVWYFDSTGSVVTVSVDGASSGVGFTTITASGSAAWKKARLTGLNIIAGSRIKLTITTVGTGFLVSGIKIFTPNMGLILDNIAQSGSLAGGTGFTAWADNTATGLGSVYPGIAGARRQITDGTTTSGSPNFGSATAAFTNLDIGEAIDWTPTATAIINPFPANCFIGSVTSGTVAVVHTMVNGVSTPVNASATQSAQTVGIGRDPSEVHVEVGMNDTSGGRSNAQITTDITTIRNTYPNSDVILHLVHEINPAVVSSAAMLAFQQTMYLLADALDVPLYDWRGRVGSYAQGIALGVYGDVNVHLNAPTYADIGASLAWIVGGGSGLPTTANSPVRDEQVVNKLTLDKAAIKAVDFLAPSVGGVGGYETTSRALGPGLINQATTNARLHLFPIVIPKGYPVGHIGFLSGTTAAALPQHWWFGLYDSAGVQLAVTADQTSTAWAANTVKTLAIATTAEGALTSFLTKYSGLYFVGYAAQATTSIPSLMGIAAPNAQAAAVGTAVVAGLSDSAITTPPGFPHTATAVSGATGIAWAYVTT